MIDAIKMGIIGLGKRGEMMMQQILRSFPDVEISALCDAYEDRVEKACAQVVEARNMKPKCCTDYREVLANDEVNVVMISAAWEAHVPLAVATMKAGKITALEVGGAYSIEDCWKLVRTYEETKTPFMFLENCCYGKNELLATSLVRNGVLGEVVYCHGAYRHDLREEIAYGLRDRHYRLRNYMVRNCDNYPTHELGPIAKLLNINRGNRMLTLNSVSSKARGLSAYVKKKAELTELHDKNFAQGDVVETHITCADGTLISLKLDTTLPHKYSREFTVNGTKGMYCEDGNYVLEEGKYQHEAPMKEYFDSAENYKEYLPKVWQEIDAETIKSGHGGVDFIELNEFFNAVRTGAEMPIDVYDAAAWMSITCLSEISIKNNGAPVEIPDFTGGQWVMREPKDVLELKK